MDTLDLLRQVAGRTEIIMRACQKINEGITDLSAAMSSATPTQPGRDLNVLTKRHREIFDLMAQQVPPGEIAKRLKLSRRTIDSHRDTIRKRLGFATADDLIEFAKLHSRG